MLVTKSCIAGAWCVLYVDKYPYIMYINICIDIIYTKIKKNIYIYIYIHRELHWLYCINFRKVRGNGEDQDLSMGHEVKDPWVLGP